ncbi:Predicted transcriptional regulator YdeE, contains AraC-type DNA-binding domain [Paenibacillus sp. OK060]|uniref:effector binding domain-containing protein n=1 Tax=Paenibacillus sp. OK060 TaxID=1881034 RepID=UPI0008911B5C|nr:Imm41 family immunity protein [Paenibacillus sp. OK060]SDM22440.1 Predicted transcriptional regulator YdeE, contains AraC-type DNA-binding domain [Paenibacillus sp. OK060]
MEQSLQELLRNARAEENTFLYMLHEEARIDQLLFWKYVNSIVELTRLTADQPLDREMASAVSFTYSKIMEHLQWHHSDRDVYEIQQFPYEYANLMVDCLGRVVDGFFKGIVLEEERFDEEFPNPASTGEMAEEQPAVLQLGYYKQNTNVHAIGFREEDGTYRIVLNEEEDRELFDSKLSRREVEGTYLFMAPDASSAHQLFHEWVMGNHTPYRSALDLKGAHSMNVKDNLIEQQSLTFVGIKRTFSCVDGENLREIPKMWQEALADGIEDRLNEFNNGAVSGLVGICIDQRELHSDQMEYWIATSHSGEVPEGLFSIEIPASHWMVFEADELAPEAIQRLWKYIMSEWYGATPYKHAGIPELEVYRGQGLPPQVWIPVKPLS